MANWRPRWKSLPVTPGDLTVILLTLNKLPAKWQAYHQRELTLAIEEAPLIVDSKIEVNWQRSNTEYLLQQEAETPAGRVRNIYQETLLCACLATTPYVAITNDDCLYPPEHFTAYRPPLDQYGYNANRWSLNQWEDESPSSMYEPCYYYNPFPDDPVLIAPREKLIADLTDALAVEGDRIEVDALAAGQAFYTEAPVIHLHHDRGLNGPTAPRREKPWPVKAISLPYWGFPERVFEHWRD